MKAFSFTETQISSIVAALVADELGWRFKRHMDSLSIASMTAATRLGEDGLGLDELEKQACGAAVARFFGLPPDAIVAGAPDSLGEFSTSVSREIARNLRHFAFTPAGRDSATDACRHDADVVFAEAAAASNLLYGRRRIFSLVAPHSLMGFVLTVLMPNLQQIPTVDARGMAPDALNAALAFGDAVVATPTLWLYLVKEGLFAPDNAMSVSFGERMSPELSSSLRKAGFGAHREIYGSTETGLIGWRDSPGDPFMLFDAVRRSSDGLMRRKPDGAEIPVLPMDILNWESEQRFRLGGRRDGAVQVGAVNVFPSEIARTISLHEKVEGCIVRVSRTASGANQLTAHIKLASGAPPAEAIARSIDAWCKMQLRPQERPRIYNFESELEP